VGARLGFSARNAVTRHKPLTRFLFFPAGAHNTRLSYIMPFKYFITQPFN